MGYRDRHDHPAQVASPPADVRRHARIGDLQGADYRRNAFTRGTDHETGVLAGLLDLEPGMRVLDVGCGDARHLRALAGHVRASARDPRASARDRRASARDGIARVGVDVSEGLLRAARGRDPDIHLLRADARRLPLRARSVDAAMSICQGAFGTHPGTDAAVLDELARVLRPGGRLALTAYHGLFAARHLVPGDAFDPVAQIHHQVSEVVDGDGGRHAFDLWSTTYTAREIRWLLRDHGFGTVSVAGVEPGRFDGTAVGLDDPELLVVAVRR